MQPLAGSWQDRVKAAKKAEKRAAKKAAKAAAAESPDAAAPTSDLPPGWQAMVDKASGDVYYGNLSTKVGAECSAVKCNAMGTSRCCMLSGLLLDNNAGRTYVCTEQSFIYMLAPLNLVLRQRQQKLAPAGLPACHKASLAGA